MENANQSNQEVKEEEAPQKSPFNQLYRKYWSAKQANKQQHTIICIMKEKIEAQHEEMRKLEAEAREKQHLVEVKALHER